MTYVIRVLGLLVVLGTATEAFSQPQIVGTFRWQLTPFCNLVAVTVTLTGGVYTLDGFDDQCGAGQRASIVGTAFLNPDGTVGLGFTTVLAPGGTPVHVDARISLASLNGPFQDSAGNSGTFVFTPGAGTGGPPRTIPPNGIAPGSITATQLAPGAVGNGQIDPNQVQTRVTGVCPVGQYLRGIAPNGSVVCEPLLTPNASTAVDGPSNVGSYTSIAIGVDGLPIISHLANVDALRVTHCGTAACTAGNVSTTVDDTASAVGMFSSLAIGADGLPVIGHYDSTAKALRVTHCGNVTCTTATSITVDDQVNDVGFFTSLAIGVDGLPIISYADLTAGTLRVTHCGNAACTNANTSTTIDDHPTNVVGAHTSIAIGTDGLPIVAHQDFTARALRVTHCGNVACTAGNASTTVDDPTNDVGEYISIAIGADGFPIISHQDSAADALRVTHCGNVTCTAGNVSTTVDDPAHAVGLFSSIAIGVDGLPIISYLDGATNALRVMHCGNAACTDGNVSTPVDDITNIVGYYTSIAIATDGLPVISHRDNTGTVLRVTKCATKTCQ